MNLQELPALRGDGPPLAIRIWGVVALGTVTVLTILGDPGPSLSGDGAVVTLALVAALAGLWLSIPRRELPPGRRLAGLALVGVAAIALLAVQPDGAGFAFIYWVVVIAGMRLDTGAAVAVVVVCVGAQLAVFVLQGDGEQAIGHLLAVLPWFLVMRAFRGMRTKGDQLEEAILELHDSRAAHAEAAAAEERARVARDMHDVLAHSLSALSLQLEGARLLARDRGADPEVVASIERAHHLAAGGLVEARQAIGALHGDELPGPERLQALVDAFDGAPCTLVVSGEPRGQGSSEARLAVYRTAQEALTNIRKHSVPARVEVRLDHAADGTTLVVEDHGAPLPVPVGGSGGYGLSGMRERAELLGGRLDAGPTADGFRVELWLPAQ